MIVLITTRGHGYTFRTFVRKTFGVPTPKVRTVTYEQMLGRWWVPRATYAFGDLERLAPWELRLAADLFRSFKDAGLRCLNDPARAMARPELLTALHANGINPFTAYRADERPRPARFPVFLRHEDNHLRASDNLYHDQDELDRALAGLRDNGTPLRGLLVIEYCAEPYGADLWAKWGTWRIGDAIVFDHLVVDDTWLVKTGDGRKQTDETIADEHQAFATGRFDAELRRAFDVAGIEFGRADHARVGGRTVIYEINTNPYLPPLSRGPNKLQMDTRVMIRTRIAEALAAIDTPARGRVGIRPTALRRPIRWWRPGFATPKRP